MITRLYKIKVNALQKAKIKTLLFQCEGVFNWASRKIEQDSRDEVYYSEYDLFKLVAGHPQKSGIPQVFMRGAISQAVMAWKRCFKKLAKKPRLKSKRNRLNSLYLEKVSFDGNRVKLPFLKSVKFNQHKKPINAQIKSARLVIKPSGFFVAVVYDAESDFLAREKTGSAIGLDPGLKDLLTDSNGIRYNHPEEKLIAIKKRISQAQKGINRKLVAKLYEREANIRKESTIKIARHLVVENDFIAFSNDNFRWLQKTHGKSAARKGLATVRDKIQHYARLANVEFTLPSSRQTTMTCSACGELNRSLSGYAGLKIRNWECGCGAKHDRDENAAINILVSGLVQASTVGASQRLEAFSSKTL